MKKLSVMLICGLLWLNAAAQSELYIIDGGNMLYRVDPSSCSVTFIGQTDLAGSFVFYDIAINPITNVMYGITDGGYLCSIDKSTAHPALIDFTAGINALAFNSNGDLYGASANDNTLYWIDQHTGWPTVAGYYLPNTSSGGDLVFFHEKLYLTTAQQTLQYIDLDDFSNSVELGTLPGAGATFGITSDYNGCSSQMYSFAANEMYNVNILNVAGSSLQCILPDIFYIYGAASTSEAVVTKPVDIGPDVTQCGNAPVTLNAIYPNATYSWQDNSTDPVFHVQQGGKYWVTISVEDCTSSDTVMVDMRPIPFVQIGKDSLICTDEQITLGSIVQGATYEWQDHSTQPFYTVDKPGIYSVQATLDGCRFKDSIRIQYDECAVVLKMPNLITPNGDHENDVFEPIEIRGVKSVRTEIVNIWGDVVFRSESARVQWDGASVEEGVYYWNITCFDFKNNELHQKGWVQVMK